MAYPSRAGFSPNSWFDHFTSLDLTKWGQVTSGTGAITATDSYVQLASPANSAAFIYFLTQLDKTKSQLWLICFNQSTLDASSFDPRFMNVFNGASAPTADTKANQDAKTIIERTWSGNGIRVGYYDNAAAGHAWSGASVAWIAGGSAGATDVDANARADDHYIVGLEIDGVNARWRALEWGQTYSAGFTFNQGARLFALTDWVNWSATRSNANLWLTIGNPFTNSTAANTTRVEWVRYIEAPADNSVMDAWLDVSSTTGPAAAKAQTQHYYSYDGYVFVPQDRTTLALSLGGTTYDDLDISPTSVAFDGVSTDYIAYQSSGSVTANSINFASATHANPQNGPWAKSANNPAIVKAGSETIIGFPYLFMDKRDTDANKRWKLLFSVKLAADSKWRLHLATSPDPPTGGTWTRQGVILDVGASGAFDETAARDGIPVYVNGQWEVWYEGWDNTATQALAKIGRATGPTLTQLTKDGAGARISNIANADTTLTANLTGRTATVTSTTGMQADAPIVFVHSATGHDYSYSRIRKVTDQTHLELYHGLDGFTTTLPDRCAQNDSTKYWSPRAVVRVGGQWWYFVNLWGFMQTYDGASYAAYRHQVGGLMLHGADLPIGGTPVLDQLTFPNACPTNYANATETVENITLSNPAYAFAGTFGDLASLVAKDVPTLRVQNADATTALVKQMATWRSLDPSMTDMNTIMARALS